MNKEQLLKFIEESNKIEGISVHAEFEIEAYTLFIEKEYIIVQDLVDFVKVIQPYAQLRDSIKVMDVRVGNHVPIRSGPEVRNKLNIILETAGVLTPYQTHVKYETLHPFTDGNGRSGRVLWLWQMLHSGESGRVARTGFLHSYYYQSLDNESK